MYQKAFTAIEVMVTLFIAALFIFSGYGLFSYVYQETTNSKNRAIASNIAEAHLKKRAATATMDDCEKPESSLVKTESPFEGEKLKDLTITTQIDFPYGCETKLIRINTLVEYSINSIKQQEKQVLYVEK